MNAWPTALFVLLWSSGAIFSRWGLDQASPFVLLALRFGVALTVLVLLAGRGRGWLPAPGTRAQVAGTGLLLVGGYSCTYFLALDQGLTPGALATILGVQPIATLLLQERRAPALRWLGLALALIGLVLVVLDSLLRASRRPSAMPGRWCWSPSRVCTSPRLKVPWAPSPAICQRAAAWSAAPTRASWDR